MGADSTKRSLGWVLGLTSLPFFMVVLDSLIVITALPRMQRDLHVGLPTLQWTVNAYGIAFAAGIITAAALGAACSCSGSPCSRSPPRHARWRPTRRC
jgi:MFS family permease